MSFERSSIPSSTSDSGEPDSRALVMSALAAIQRSRSLTSSKRRAFSMAMPAATASVDRTASSSASNSIPPRFSVR